MSKSILINLAVLFQKPTGIATYALNVAKHLQDLNPTLLTAYPQSDFNCYAIADDMTPAQGSKGHLRRLWWTQSQLPKIWNQLQSDLVYSPLPEAPLFSKCRSVVMCHDLIPLRFPSRFSPLTNYFRYVVPLVLQQAEHILCNSESTAQDIVDFYGIDASKITPILLAYDRQHFYPRDRLNSASTRPYFLYLGRQDPYKNIARLISAFADLPDRANYDLYLAGARDPRFAPELEQQIAELEITHQVKWLNYIDYQELPSLLSNALALVFPTLWEGFGLPVLEAMACGTPVITSNLASLPEVTGDAAILIDPYDTRAITSAMNEIAGDSKRRSQLSQLSLARAKLFSWQQTGEQTKEVLERFI